MSKKVLVFLIIIILAVAAGGFFYWWEKPRSQLRQWWTEEIEMEGSVRDFSIQRSPTKTIVENTRENLRVVVPEGWETQKAETVFYDSWGVHLLSPDVKIKAYDAPDLYLLDKGCLIDVRIGKSNLQYEVLNMDIEGTKKLPNYERPTIEKDEMELVSIDNHFGIKDFVGNEKTKAIIKRIEVRIPLKKDKYIYIVFVAFPEDEKKCSNEFDEFLKEVSID